MTQVDLYSHDQTYFHFSIASWHWALTLAKYYGWKPKGTKPTSTTKKYYRGWQTWDGSYFALQHQLVEKDDALSLSQAIHNALKDIPDVHITRNAHISPLEYWSGKECKFYLFDFMEFCQKGAFIIA